MAEAIVYGLSCLDGPVLYVGATTKEIGHRISEHWGLKNSGLSPVNVWLRKFNSKSDLKAVVLHASEKCSLKYKELSEIRSRAIEVWSQYRILILNVPHNPFCFGEERVNASALNGMSYRLAEHVSPYCFAVTTSEATR